MADNERSIPAFFAKLLIFLSFITLALCTAIHQDEFSEELFIKPFKNGHVMFNFRFTTLWNVSIAEKASFEHYRLFPKSVGDAVSTFGVQELHLSQTQGLWRYQKWGYPPEDAPPGAELWVWFKENMQSIDKTWPELVNALSGMFCSSLNFMDNKVTVSPRWSFRPEGLASEHYSYNSRLLRYSALPREIVCTENLTPWKKLLPCDSKLGLSTLFNAIKLYDSSYHSLGFHIRPVCQDAACSTSAIELRQTLTVVFDPTINRFGKQSWSLASVFGKPMYSKCPVASISNVYLDVTNKDDKISPFTVVPDASEVKNFTRGEETRQFAVYNVGDYLAANGMFDLTANYQDKITYTDDIPPPVYAHRFVSGFGLEKGGIVCQIYNSLPDNLTVIYMETIPWYFRVYLNTIKITNDGQEIKPFKMHFIPGQDRAKSYQLEVVFRLRASSVTRISLSFDRAFLKWTEYPPDANHGFYVNSAVISTVLPSARQYTALQQSSSFHRDSMHDGSDKFFLRIHTETLLISLPTPDFSMPYNVICLACTVIAIAFGSIHNLTTRVFKVTDPKKAKSLKDKIMGMLGRKSTVDVKSESELKDNNKENKEVTNKSDNDGETEDSSGEIIDDSTRKRNVSKTAKPS